jgi:hypothetical protein
MLPHVSWPQATNRMRRVTSDKDVWTEPPAFAADATAMGFESSLDLEGGGFAG